jgi:hypothetical protein
MAEYVVTPEEKQDWEELAHALNKLAAIWAGGAALLLATGAGAAPGTAAAVASAGFWYLSDVAGDVADDPPKPNYRSATKVRPLKAKLPGVRRPIFRAVNREAKIVLRAIPLAVAALDSLEKYGGAEKANDERYSRLHARNALRFRRRAVKELTRLRQDLTKLSARLKGTEFDVKVDHHLWKATQKRIRVRGLPSDQRKALRAAGFSRDQIKRYEKWAARSFRATVPPARLSYLLKVGRNILQRAERKLAKRLR